MFGSKLAVTYLVQHLKGSAFPNLGTGMRRSSVAVAAVALLVVAASLAEAKPKRGRSITAALKIDSK